MNAINANIDHDTLITFGNELTTSSGIRAVSAWLALCEPDSIYTLDDDDDAPYEFRGAVGEDIGWDMACEDLDPHHDIPRYLDYVDLHSAYGTEWPILSLTDYLGVVMGMDREQADAEAQVIWRAAIERYEGHRVLVLEKEKASTEAMIKCLQELLQKLAA